jgi:hypothetical protein
VVLPAKPIWPPASAQTAEEEEEEEVYGRDKGGQAGLSLRTGTRPTLNLLLILLLLLRASICGGY